MILVVSYDLKGPAGSYGSLYETLKQQGHWWHYLKSTWLISTDKTPRQVFQALRPYIQPSDHMLITQMGSASQGWLPKAAWDWIHKYEQNPSLFVIAKESQDSEATER